MLERALQSCAGINPPPTCALEFIIAENGPEKTAQSVIKKFDDRLNIQLINEPRIGVVHARNACIEQFLKGTSDWMVSFDDDVIVSSGWLQALLLAIPAYPDCKVFAGPQVRLASKNAGRWLPHRPFPALKTGTINWNASTANVIFNRIIFDPDGLNLRFDPAFNLSGGEDTRMFYMLKDLKQNIRWISDAIVTEPTPETRATFKARASRFILQAHNWGRLNVIRFGPLWGRALVFWFMFASALNVLTLGLIGVFALVYSERLGIKVFNKSLINGCEAIGYFRALFLSHSQFYARTDGD